MTSNASSGVNRREMLTLASAAALAASSAQAGQSTGGTARPTIFANIGVYANDRVTENTGLAVAQGKIAAIADTASLRAQYPDADVYDGRGKVVMPGLVNCHAHLAATIERGFNEDFGFPNSASLALKPSSLLSPDERRLMVVVGALEAIRTGTTTLVENTGGIAPNAAALAESGLRMVFAESIRDSTNVAGPMAPEGLAASVQPAFSKAALDEGMARITALHARWHGADAGRISVMPAAALAETSSPALLKAVRAFAEKHGLSYTIHLSQSLAEVDFMKRWHGVSPVAYLAAHGFLGPRLFAAHLRYVDAADIALLGQSRTNLTHQAGMAANRGIIPPVPLLRAAGVGIALGTDNNTNDVFSVMRTALLTERISRKDPFPGTLPQPEDIFEDATMGGATALGLQSQIGSIEVGKKADLIVVDTMRAHLVPYGRFISTLIHNGQPSDIESTMIDGRFIMRNRKVLTYDEAAIIAEADKVGRRVWRQVKNASPIAIPGRPKA
jgi:cytosine/adenosine deaminase-related metal-dependent hydrolase